MIENEFSDAKFCFQKHIADSITNSVDEISFEDRKFLDIVEKKTSKKNYHYVVPLPFRDDRLLIPNNRGQAYRRLIFLKRFRL